MPWADIWTLYVERVLRECRQQRSCISSQFNSTSIATNVNPDAMCCIVLRETGGVLRQLAIVALEVSSGVNTHCCIT